MILPGVRQLADRLHGTPAVHLADQVLSSGTNFLAVVIVARRATPEEFGTFSIFLLAFFVTAGFSRAVPHAVAMTMEWEDDRGRVGYFFLPPLALGGGVSLLLVAAFAVLDPGFLPLAALLLALLLQDGPGCTPSPSNGRCEPSPAMRCGWPRPPPASSSRPRPPAPPRRGRSAGSPACSCSGPGGCGCVAATRRGPVGGINRPSWPGPACRSA